MTDNRPGCRQVLTALLLGIIGLALCGIIALTLNDPDAIPNLLNLNPKSALPTAIPVAIVPTSPPSPTNTNTPLPTHTPTATPTITPASTSTATPTHTPTATPTRPTVTPSITPTPNFNFTPTATIIPTAAATNTRSPFPFTLDKRSPRYRENFANDDGCRWLGMAGEVHNLNSDPVPLDRYRVRIWGNGLDVRVDVGDAPVYYVAGWEQQLFDSPVAFDYNVQLETVNGTPVSRVYQIQTHANCDQNLVYIIFIQNH